MLLLLFALCTDSAFGSCSCGTCNRPSAGVATRDDRNAFFRQTDVDLLHVRFAAPDSLNRRRGLIQSDAPLGIQAPFDETHRCRADLSHVCIGNELQQ